MFKRFPERGYSETLRAQQNARSWELLQTPHDVWQTASAGHVPEPILLPNHNLTLPSNRIFTYWHAFHGLRDCDADDASDLA